MLAPNRDSGFNIDSPTNDAASVIAGEAPYTVTLTIEGQSPLLFARYAADAIDARAKTILGSRQRTEIPLEEFVYRCPNGNLGLPGTNFFTCVTEGAKWIKHPRGRGSAKSVYEAGVMILTDVADLNTQDWEFVDRRRALVNRATITRQRPALRAGWEATFEVLVQLPQHISQHDLLNVINLAGRLVGIGSYRPTFGRFTVTRFDVDVTNSI